MTHPEPPVMLKPENLEMQNLLEDNAGHCHGKDEVHIEHLPDGAELFLYNPQAAPAPEDLSGKVIQKAVKA